MEEIKVLFTNGEGSGTIDFLIEFLEKAKKEGATHYKMEWSNDPMWAFKWLNTYRILSEEEVKEEKRKQLKQQLKELDD